MLNSVHDNWMDRLAFGLAFILVLMGLANNLPNIPGLLELIQSIPGLSELPRISKYNSEFFLPTYFHFYDCCSAPALVIRARMEASGGR